MNSQRKILVEIPKFLAKISNVLEKNLNLKDFVPTFKDTGKNLKGCFQSLKSFDLNLICFRQNHSWFG